MGRGTYVEDGFPCGRRRGMVNNGSKKLGSIEEHEKEVRFFPSLLMIPFAARANLWILLHTLTFFSIK